ncbi:MAG: glycosyltransferase [Candidatus Omnitrophica bacterium]|nr:glycosyltransferase [Candidatus Omnitrophota bacterium]
MHSSNPFFSIIIPTHNRKYFLEIAVNSVLYQTYADFELIIIDDGSTDGTLNAIRHTLNAENIKYIYQENRGPAAARNRGINEARGKFICFLDSDDRFRKEKLEITRYYIEKMPQYDIFHTNEIWYRKGELLPQKIYHAKPTGFVFENALKLCCISISTVAIRRDIFNAVGLFDENMPACEDYDFWLRVTPDKPVCLIPHYLTIKEGGHPDQQSFRFNSMDKFRIYSIEKILKNTMLPDTLRAIAFNELKRKCKIYIEGARKRAKMQEVEYVTKLLRELNV